ncbi:response regulator transcription factor [Anabaena sp. FACHB-709]|nr:MULTISPECIES: response regulator transcription factor [Nostocaceae]MBD2174774.1 response regulator transcription factor [Anabaena cylindrica FACHB-318]MBD2266535.1 response regulator transcription factor [Anabaena sp. FACHB-709]MBD2276126.1 response regulator transcription factor [Nostoc sp. PCC 7120 = FACHB-418]MBD2352353.1 response regulator transcription factor [Trichormus variabilis FACHB-171]BAB76118.1 asl4419 [Nostoc sp. PCC 7120 = FACHB-418]
MELASPQQDTKSKLVSFCLDMMMPSYRWSDRFHPQIKIIAISGLLSEPHESAIANMGVKAFLSKPCTAKELVQTIHTVHTDN